MSDKIVVFVEIAGQTVGGALDVVRVSQKRDAVGGGGEKRN
jgi:hypothetical protein